MYTPDQPKEENEITYGFIHGGISDDDR